MNPSNVLAFLVEVHLFLLRTCIHIQRHCEGSGVGGNLLHKGGGVGLQLKTGVKWDKWCYAKIREHLKLCLDGLLISFIVVVSILYNKIKR